MESFQYGIFPKFPSLTSHWNLRENFWEFSTPLQPYFKPESLNNLSIVTLEKGHHEHFMTKRFNISVYFLLLLGLFSSHNIKQKSMNTSHPPVVLPTWGNVFAFTAATISNNHYICHFKPRQRLKKKKNTCSKPEKQCATVQNIISASKKNSSSLLSLTFHSTKDKVIKCSLTHESYLSVSVF